MAWLAIESVFLLSLGPAEAYYSRKPWKAEGIYLELSVDLANVVKFSSDVLLQLVEAGILSIDDFDAEAYISSKTETNETVETGESNGDDMESLRAQYFEKHGSHVPNVKKNDISWIKSKLI